MNEPEPDILRDNVERLVSRSDPRVRLPDAERGRILASLTRKETVMNRRLVFSLAVAAAVVAAVGIVWFVARAEPDAAAVLQRADAARAAGDPEGAFEDYVRVASWSGTGTGAPSEGDRFKASLEAVKCEIAAGRAAEGVVRYETLFAAFPAIMSAPDAYKHSLAVFGALMQQGADPAAGMTLLGLVAQHHPDRKAAFESLVAQWADRGDVDKEGLRQLGYLDG